jgi:hypothetical protein
MVGESMTPDTSDFSVVDLFSGLGGFSQAFEESNRWDVVTVDIKGEFDPDIQADIMELQPDDLEGPDVVLASPPCRRFSVAAINSTWDHSHERRPKHLPEMDDVAEFVAYVFRTLWLVQELKPRYWFLENPQGMLRKWIGAPVDQVHYCQYGSDFKKPTDLWGRHPPMNYRHCPGNPACGHVGNPREVNTFRDESRTRAVDSSNSAERAKVPYELSLAIRQAVEAAIENPPPEQTELTEVSNART